MDPYNSPCMTPVYTPTRVLIFTPCTPLNTSKPVALVASWFAKNSAAPGTSKEHTRGWLSKLWSFLDPIILRHLIFRVPKKGPQFRQPPTCFRNNLCIESRATFLCCLRVFALKGFRGTRFQGQKPIKPANKGARSSLPWGRERHLQPKDLNSVVAHLNPNP